MYKGKSKGNKSDELNRWAVGPCQTISLGWVGLPVILVFSLTEKT